MQIEKIHFAPPGSKEPSQLREAAEDCIARAGIYRLLSGAFAEEPSAGFLGALREPGAQAALAEMGLVFDADFSATPLAQLEDALACEYATLFASPGGCAPVESSRLTGRMQQEPFYEVQADYHRLGFEVQQGRFATFEDHLGVELAFIAALLDQAGAAARSADEQQFRRLDKEIKRFWSLHLGRWARGYGQLVERATEHSFYREMAKLLYAFAEEEISHMGLKVEDADGSIVEPPKPETIGLQCGGAPKESAGEQPFAELPAVLQVG